MDDKKIEKKAKAIPDGVPILAWEFDKKDTPSIIVFTKTNGKVYIEKSAQHESGCIVLDGYRKQSDTVREFIKKLKYKTTTAYYGASRGYQSKIKKRLKTLGNVCKLIQLLKNL